MIGNLHGHMTFKGEGLRRELALHANAGEVLHYKCSQLDGTMRSGCQIYPSLVTLPLYTLTKEAWGGLHGYVQGAHQGCAHLAYPLLMETAVGFATPPGSSCKRN